MLTISKEDYKRIKEYIDLGEDGTAYDLLEKLTGIETRKSCVIDFFDAYGHYLGNNEYELSTILETAGFNIE